MEVEFVNLTPHKINLFREDGTTVEIEPSGIIARVNVEQREVGKLNGFPVKKTIFGKVENLPEPQKGKIYIVSTLVLNALKENMINRDDVVAPDTNPKNVVLDEFGRIVGVKCFQIL